VVQLWWLVQDTLFRYSPQFLYGWRNGLLRLFGAEIGRGVLVRPTARVTYPWKLSIGDNSWIGDFAELYTLDRITVGRNAVVSQHAYVCTGSHDIGSPGFDLVLKPIAIEDEAWVAAGVFVFPGVTVGRGSVVGARSILRADTEPYGVYAGAPAVKVGERRPEQIRPPSGR
jgi:putative colanic acid biosynthesis acetyltransferase WcaF